MHPIFFQIGFLTVYAYGVMLALAVVICAWLLGRDAVVRGINKEIIYDLMFWVVVGGIIGARIFYIAISWDYFSDNLAEMMMINRGGLAWQGGFLGGAIAGIWFTKIKKLSLRLMLDLTAPYIALGQSIGRIGCFLNGCCYGKPWAHGVLFPHHDAPVHPTQLYETTSLFCIFLVLKLAQRKNYPAGVVFATYLWLAAIERFLVEFVRGDSNIFYAGLSLFQYVAMVIFVAGLILFFRFKK